MIRPASCLALLVITSTAFGDITVDFSDRALPGANTFDNGSDLNGGFTSNTTFFNNTYKDFGSFYTWKGWSYSNVNDPTTAGFGNQFAAITGTGVGGSGPYAIAYDDGLDTSYINLPTGSSALSFYITNTTYAYLSMITGDSFAKKFTTGDFLQVQVRGYTGDGATGSLVGEVDTYLANYTTPTDTPVNTWQFVDVSSLAGAKSLGFTMASSDVGSFGINTPTYFAFDSLTLATNPVPEPTSFLLIATGLSIALVARKRIQKQRA
jgi:hypothetical protein